MLLCLFTQTSYSRAQLADFRQEQDPVVAKTFQLIALFKEKTAHTRKQPGEKLSAEMLHLRNSFIKPMMIQALAASRRTEKHRHLADCRELKRRIKEYIAELEQLNGNRKRELLPQSSSPEMMYFSLEQHTPAESEPGDENQFEKSDDEEEVSVLTPTNTSPDLDPIQPTDDSNNSEPYRDSEIDGEYDVNNEMSKVEPIPLGDAINNEVEIGDSEELKKTPQQATPLKPTPQTARRGAPTAVTKTPPSEDPAVTDDDEAELDFEDPFQLPYNLPNPSTLDK